MKILSDLFKRKETPAPMIPHTVSVRMQDGSIEEYDETFMITDGVNCVVCNGKLYHTSLDCESLKWERGQSEELPRAMTVTNAKKQGMTYCYDCSRSKYLYENEDDE